MSAARTLAKTWSTVLGALLALAAACALAGASPAQDDIVTPIEDLEPLAELIGAAHQVRQLCDSTDQSWREQMLALIDIEAGDDERRQRRLIEAFNEGFRRQQEERLRCGVDARAAESELAVEGRRLAERLRDRYLN